MIQVQNPQQFQNSSGLPKTQVQLSKSGEAIIFTGEGGEKLTAPVNLVKHILGMAYVKKDGTQVQGRQTAATPF